MPEINPLTNNQIFLKKIAENTGSNYETGDVSEINPLTIDQIFLKEIAANTAGQSGDITELEEKVTATQDIISDAYDSTHTYNVGDYCIYENVLYKCNTASTTGTWDSSKWDAVTVAVELGELTERESDRYVSVVGDGVKTHQQLMNDLYALVDRSKLTKKSKFGFYYNSTLEWYCSLSFMSANKLQFDGITGGSPTDLMTYHWELSSTLADCYRIDYDMTSSGLTITNKSSEAPSVTNEYRVYY